jgi:mRNA interferase MazF
MGAFVKGEVVVMPFPFSDLSANKRRPALVLASLPGDDLVVCQITSQTRLDPYAVPLEDTDFVSGGLKQSSLIRVSRIFTAESSIVLYRAGTLSTAKQREVSLAIARLFNLET